MNSLAARYLRDALGEAEELQLDLMGLELTDFVQSRQLKRIAERSLEIIGEALRRALDKDVDLRLHNDELREWVALRNIISHQYDRLLPEALWDTATEDVAILIEELKILLESEPND